MIALCQGQILTYPLVSPGFTAEGTQGHRRLPCAWRLLRKLDVALMGPDERCPRSTSFPPPAPGCLMSHTHTLSRDIVLTEGGQM